MAKNDLAHIYALLALRIRHSFPRYLQFLSKFYMYKSQRKADATDDKIPNNLAWALGPIGHEFIYKNNWTFGQKCSFLTQETEDLDPLSIVTRYFRENCLQRALMTLVSPSSNSKIEEVLSFIEMTNETNVFNEEDISSTTLVSKRRDNVAKWSASVLATGAHWMMDNHSPNSYAAHCQVVDAPPITNENEEFHPIIEALSVAFSTQKLLWSSLNNSTLDCGTSPSAVLTVCDSASTKLEMAIEFSKHHNLSNSTVVKNGLLLCCDWILNTRTHLWQKELILPSSAFLSAYQKDLNSLRKLADVLPGTLPRVFLHEATVRLIAGAAPGKTQQLLDRSVRHKSNSSRSYMCGGGDGNNSKSNLEGKMYFSGEREHATALYMACRHLPSQLLSSPGERIGMLTEAARILEKIGDLKSLHECYKLMKHLGSANIST